MLPYLILVIFAIQPALNLPQHPSITSQDKETRQQKGINIAYPLPITHHLLVPSQLHVLPATSNVRHSSVHTGVQHIVTSNGNIPVFSQTVSHSSTNITHPTKLMPILVPIQHNLAQHMVSQQNLQHLAQNHLAQHNLVSQLQNNFFHDLSVIPLHRAQKFGHLRVEKKAEDREDVGHFRTIYGGFGNGLYFGGHGAGHGFYAYGK